METKYINTVETAKIVKKILNDYWPDIKWSVRSDKYAGGSSLKVKWTDGPTEGQVKEITDYFEGASFDGMIDLKSYVKKIELDENGDEINVSYGPDYIFPSRKTSENFVKQVAKVVIDYYNLDESLLQKVKENYGGSYHWDVWDVKPFDNAPDNLTTYFHRFARKMEADKDGNIKKPRLSSSYLKELAAKAYAQDDMYIFINELEKDHGIDSRIGKRLYWEYERNFKDQAA